MIEESRLPPKTRNMDWFQKFSVYLLIILSVTVSFQIYRVIALSAPSIGATIEPGSTTEGCRFTVYKDGSTYLAKDGSAGGNAYSGTAFSSIVQNALNNGGRTCLAPGSYTPTAGISFVTRSELVMDKNAIIDAGNVDLGTLFLCNSKSDVKIIGGQIQNLKGYSIQLKSCSRVWIEETYQTNIQNGASSFGRCLSVEGGANANNYVWFQNNFCDTAVDDGVLVDVSSTNIWIQNNRFNNVGSVTSPPIDVVGRNIWVEGNSVLTASGGTSCIQVGGASPVSQNITISGNYLSSCGTYGITLSDGGHTVIGNTIVSSGRSGLAVNSNNNRITGNRIYNPGSANVAGDRDGTQFVNGLNNTFTSNTVIDDRTGASKRMDNYVRETGTSNFNIIVQNVFSGALNAGGLALAGANDIVRANIGYVTENGGAATISASTTVTFNHGLVTIPTFVTVTPQSTGYGTFAVTSATATQVTITVTVSGTYTFYWYARYCPSSCN